MTCPCCGQALPEKDLLIDLNTNTVVKGGREVKLSPQQAEVLHTLHERAPRQVSHDDLYHAVWGFSEGPEHPRDTIRVVVSTLRRKLAGMGVHVRVIHSCGYRLELQ